MPYDAINYRNMVDFYAPELKRIIQGGHILKVFQTKVERTRLLKQGLISYTRTPGDRHISVAPRAIDLMERPLDDLSQ